MTSAGIQPAHTHTHTHTHTCRIASASGCSSSGGGLLCGFHVIWHGPLALLCEFVVIVGSAVRGCVCFPSFCYVRLASTCCYCSCYCW
jgi:hypothetical protein